MGLRSLTCPNCNAILENANGLDTFYCSYCGHKIMITDQSPIAYGARLGVRYLQHRERMQDRMYREQRERFEKNKPLLIGILIGSVVLLLMIIVLGLFLPVIFGMIGNDSSSIKNREKELQAVVEEIIVDIEETNYSAAYIKANTLYWDESEDSARKEKWDATREEILRQIEAAEQVETGDTVLNDKE